MYQVLVGIIIAGGVGGYFYYTSTQTELTELRALNSAYELKFEQQAEALEAVQRDFELQTQSLNELQAQSQQIQVEMNRYLDIFRRHNLSKLAAAKPGLIEKKANAATKEVFDGIEKDSVSVDSLDDGVQLATEASSGGEDSNKTSGAQDSTAGITESN